MNAARPVESSLHRKRYTMLSLLNQGTHTLNMSDWHTIPKTFRHFAISAIRTFTRRWEAIARRVESGDRMTDCSDGLTMFQADLLMMAADAKVRVGFLF